MIVVFVIDTSPSMGLPLANNRHNPDSKGMSRLDLAKMTVENLARGLNKRLNEHNVQLQKELPNTQKSMMSLGLGPMANDELLLLSTSRQYAQRPGTAACGAGGRLLIGYGDPSEQGMENSGEYHNLHHNHAESFQRELKRLKSTTWEPPVKVNSNNGSENAPPIPNPFPEDGGGAQGLNIALSSGLQLLSRYRLSYRATENFGMGRLTSPAMLNPNGGASANALQPACLILLTDGVCLRSPPAEGGGSLQLQYGSLPLKEFYKEPFRWDQRIFCLGVGGGEGVSSTQYLHPHLRALCEVTGGSHLMLRSSTDLASVSDLMLKMIAPPRPQILRVPDPLNLGPSKSVQIESGGTFVGGGPVCCFQSLEAGPDGAPPVKHRAMLLLVGAEQSSLLQSEPTSSSAENSSQPPIWCIPESYFPNKKLDSLPPRAAQPHLLYSRHPANLGSKSFDAIAMITLLQRLDQIVTANRRQKNAPNQHVKLLHRDTYICEWVSVDGKRSRGPHNSMGNEHFPVLVTGAGRPVLSEGDVNFFNIGILHIPKDGTTLAHVPSSGVHVATLTLLPPEPQILLPLLLRAAEAEHRALKKISPLESKDAQKGLSQKQLLTISRNVHLDEHWRSELCAYLFRVPCYYLPALKWSLRSVLPLSAQSLLNTDSASADGMLSSQCFSKLCLQKIRTGEQIGRETNESLERQEMELRRRGGQVPATTLQMQEQGKRRWQGDQQPSNVEVAQPIQIGYGQYDPRSSTSSYLAALKTLPNPRRRFAAGHKRPLDNSSTGKQSDASQIKRTKPNMYNVLGDLPASCLLAYYESRRRWTFGGSGLTTRGIFVNGAHNDGSNSQYSKRNPSDMDESLLSLAGVGASQLNATTTMKMGDYRERLLWSRAPVVGCGSNDSIGVASTTASDGSPIWSVDDDAMPTSFFDPVTAEFNDSVQTRVKARLIINFGNPFKDKRADAIIPEKYADQSPKILRRNGSAAALTPQTPPGSPPHDAFSAVEGEGEAIFSRTSPSRTSPSRSDNDTSMEQLSPTRKASSGNSNMKDIDDTSVASTTSITSNDSNASTVTGSKVRTMPQKRPLTSPKPTMAKPAPPRPHSKMMPPPKRPPPPKPPGSARPPPPKPAPKQRGPPKVVAAPSLPREQRQKAPPAPATSIAAKAARKPKHGAPPPPPPPPSSVTKIPPRLDKPQENQQAEAPPAPKRPSDSNISVQNFPVALDLQTPGKPPEVKLPPGWVCVWSKGQKRWYFFDKKSNKSVWQWPPPSGEN